MSSVEQIEAYIAALEEFLSSSLTSVAPDLPHLNEIAHRIWADLTRFGPPSLPQLPGLGAFEVPPSAPLPPPPPPLSFSENLIDWANENKWAAATAGIGIVGASLLAGYGIVKYKQSNAAKRKESGKERREVVVVLGADHPAGAHLVLGLEAQGYIVVASVATSEAVETLNLENRSKGYVRVLVFDPREPNTSTQFLRSLQSCLSLRFPTNAAGDPYLSSSTSPFSRPYIHSLISLLSLFPTLPPTPLESVSFTDSYIPYMTRTHISPLRVIQSLLPLLRRASRFPGEGTIRKSIIVCVPAISARVGVAFAGEEAMSAVATVKAVEVLRRELNASASQNTGEGIIAPKVVLVDVGSLAISRHRPVVPPIYSSPALMQTWSASEKAAYGTALECALEQAHATPRKPAHVGQFVNALVGVVSRGTRGRGYGYVYKLEWGWASLWRWTLGCWGRVSVWALGERFSVGAGAMTYSIASYLPSFVLDYLLNIPHIIASVRTTLIPAPPPPPRPLPTPPMPPAPRLIESAEVSHSKERDHDTESSDAASEPDSASVSASESGVMGGSWVSLKENTALESGKE